MSEWVGGVGGVGGAGLRARECVGECVRACVLLVKSNAVLRSDM